MIKVYADMVGDLFHPGHVAMLQAARALGDSLTVGVLSDAAVMSYKRVPVMTLAERVAVISACRYVDAVIADAPLEVTKTFLDEHEISLVVHGANITDEAIEAVYGDVRRAGKLRLIAHRHDISTTQILARIHSGEHGGAKE